MASLPIHAHPAAMPLDVLLSAIPSLPRALLDRLVERAIDRLDEIDGDVDVEVNGDELDGTGGEDDFIDRYGNNMGGNWSGAGCPIADPPDDLDDEREPDGRAMPGAVKSREAFRQRVRRESCHFVPVLGHYCLNG